MNIVNIQIFRVQHLLFITLIQLVRIFQLYGQKLGY